jgi:UDP-3-O-[3-hydroxymyristoyl] glucosamine N-acyltransferase
MKITAKKLAELLQGELTGASDSVFTGAAGLDEAGPSDVSFIANPKYAGKVAASRAGLIIISDKAPDAGAGKPSIKVKNPQLAFAKVLELLAPEMNPPAAAGIHPTAVVSKGAKVAKDAAIGPCAVIEEGAVIGSASVVSAHCYVGRKTQIGNSCRIYPNVTLREKVTLGDRVIIHSGAVLGSDGFGYAPDGKKHYKIPQIGGVEIGNDVEIGANVTIDRATTGKTRVGDGTKIDNLVQIAHNVQIGKNCILVAQVGIAGSTKIGDNVVFAGQSGAVGHVTIGNNAMIAGRSVATTDIPEGAIVSGFPAMPHREALKLEAIIRKLPELYEKMKNKVKDKQG